MCGGPVRRDRAVDPHPVPTGETETAAQFVAYLTACYPAAYLTACRRRRRRRRLQVHTGAHYYIDRDYVINGLPDFLHGCTLSPPRPDWTH